MNSLDEKSKRQLCEAFKIIVDSRKRFTANPQPPPHPIALMLERTMAVSQDTIASVKSLLKKNRVPQAECLVRMLFETSVRLLWASRKADGWDRIQADAAQQWIDWAERIGKTTIKDSNLTRRAQEILADKQMKTIAEQAKNLPDVRAMLEAIDKCDAEGEETSSGDANCGLFLYFAVYGLLSNTVHGHMVAIRQQDSIDKAATISAEVLGATLMVVRAVYHTAGWEIEEVLKSVLRELGPSDAAG